MRGYKFVEQCVVKIWKMRRNFQWKKPNFSIWQLHLSPLILMLYILCDPYNSLILVLMVFMILMVHWCLSFLVLVSDPYGLLILILMVLGILMAFLADPIKRLFTFEFILDFFVETACILYLYLLLHCCIATKSNGWREGVEQQCTVCS